MKDPLEHEQLAPPKESVTVGKMDIVDSQLHIKPGQIEAKLAAMDALGITSALLDEYWNGTEMMPFYSLGDGIKRSTYPTAELASMLYPDRFSYLLRVNRRDPEVRSIIRIARDIPNARAVRMSVGSSVPELTALIHGEYDSIFKEAADAGLVVFITVPGNAPVLRASARKFPETSFVVDHCGMPYNAALRAGLAAAGHKDIPLMGDGPKEEEFAKVLSLADLPNVALKWAHAPGLFEVAGYPFPALRSHLTAAIAAFGADRIMWAADSTSNRSGESWAELLFWLIDNPELNEADRVAILGGTARRILGWPRQVVAT